MKKAGPAFIFVACFLEDSSLSLGQYKIIILFVTVGGIIPRLFEVKREWHVRAEHVGLFVKLSEDSGGIAASNQVLRATEQTGALEKALSKTILFANFSIAGMAAPC